MKLRIDCPYCLETDKASSVQVEPTNQGRFEATCEAGHHLNISALYHDFQILFEIGINAIYDGYYREAIGSFAASYERFLEFFVRIVASSSGSSIDEFDKAWKHVRNRSEQQLGAFIFVYLMTYQESPLILLENEKLKSLRNDVVHKGKIPTRADCVRYGDGIAMIILSVLRKLWKSHQDEVIRSINEKLSDESSMQPRVIFLPWMTLPTNREPPDEADNPSIEALLDGIARAREREQG